MKVLSWNVNGLRAVLKNRKTSLKEFLDSFSADVVCLQEVKCSSKFTQRQVWQLNKIGIII